MKLSEQQLAFLSEVRFGVLATVNTDGTPQQTVMWYLPVDGDTILMNTLKGRVKDKNLERDGRASLCIEAGQQYVSMGGTIAVDTDVDRGHETMREITARYIGREEMERQFPDSYGKQHRITLTFTIDKVDTHGFEG